MRSSRLVLTPGKRPLPLDDDFLKGSLPSSRSLPSSPYDTHATPPSLRGRVSAPIPSVQIWPVYEKDAEGCPIGAPSHHALSFSNPYLEGIFGSSTIFVKKLGEGDFWSAWTVLSHPHLVVKVVSPKLLPRSREPKIQDCLRGFANFPKNPHVSLASSPTSVQEALGAFKQTGIFVQNRAEPITNFSPSHPCFHAVRDALAGMALETLSLIEDFRPRNAGTIGGQLVDFDPIDQGLGKKDTIFALRDYYLEWAGGKKDGTEWTGVNQLILAALIQPLQDTLSPTERSRTLVADLVPYLT